jgi:hypothetical protein
MYAQTNVTNCVFMNKLDDQYNNRIVYRRLTGKIHYLHGTYFRDNGC